MVAGATEARSESSSPIRRAAMTLTVLAALVSLPALIWGHGATNSYRYNFTWTAAFAEAFSRGEIYPRWLPNSFEGLGSPTFYFYPPLTFMLSGALDLSGLDTPTAVTLTGAVLSLASGLAMYAWLRDKSRWALPGAALYVLAPYHLYDLYYRGALAECAAYVWLPLLALGVERLPTRGGVLLLAGAVAGIILTHLPMAVLALAFLVAPYAVVRLWQRPSLIGPGLAAAGLGVSAAAIYLLPAMSLQQHISRGLLWTAYYRPENWFPWNQPGILYLASLPTLTVALGLAATASRSPWAALAVGAAIASLGIPPFIWDLPGLAEVQFPWRLLAVVEFAAITALMIAPVPERRIVLAGAFALLLVAVPLMTRGSVDLMLRRTDYKTLQREVIDAPEYLPPGSDLTGIGETRRIPNLSAHRRPPRGDIILVKRAGEVVVGRHDFPIWRVMRGGAEVTHRGPLITFQATPGAYKIERRLLTVEIVGAIVSGVAMLTLMLLALWPTSVRRD